MREPIASDDVGSGVEGRGRTDVGGQHISFVSDAGQGASRFAEYPMLFVLEKRFAVIDITDDPAGPLGVCRDGLVTEIQGEGRELAVDADHPGEQEGCGAEGQIRKIGKIAPIL